MRGFRPQQVGQDLVGRALALQPRGDGFVEGADHAPEAGPAHGLDQWLDEVMLFTDWYGPALDLELDRDGFRAAWEAVLAPVDTSGAGDAFNAGYLGARMNDLTIAEAVRAGHALAGWTIMRPGAIPARDS